MSVATSMKNLVEDIQVSRGERHTFIKDMTKNVKELLVQFNKEQEDLRKELKKMAEDLKHFLANSEKSRKEDFAATMKDITARLEGISREQNNVRKDARELIKEYGADNKKAKEYWLSLSGSKKSGHSPKKEESGEK